MVSPLSLLFLFIFIFIFISTSAADDSPKFLLVNCGAGSGITIDDRFWFPDSNFVKSGTSQNLNLPGLSPILSTFRSFPYRKSDGPRKFCYTLPIYHNSTYIVRTTFFYGGEGEPPVFDLVVDGTLWTVVNTTADYKRNLASYYELVYEPLGPKTTSVCLAGREYTEGDLFVSLIETVILDGAVYNGTDFKRFALGLVARTAFGYTGPVIRYPYDRFDRFWQPFTDGVHAVQNSGNVSVSGFWNIPPSKIFQTSLVAEKGSSIELQWPPAPLPSSNYYIALYFIDSLPDSSRVFNIFINGIPFFQNLAATPSGVSVFSPNWTLSGTTSLRLDSLPTSSLPPLINGGEIFGILTVRNLTITRDITALLKIKNLIRNPPSGWEGDPCFPQEYKWTGITCSVDRRVIILDLSNMGLSGTLSPNISSLSALTDILLENNRFSGSIPDLSRLKQLRRLHLQDNQFTGELPSSLGQLRNLRELFVQNNNLTGAIPQSLVRPGLNLTTSPGNHFSASPLT